MHQKPIPGHKDESDNMSTTELAPKSKTKLECGPMPNFMAAQPNIGGASAKVP